MARIQKDRLTEDEIITESRRLINDVLGWSLTQDGVDYHIGKSSSFNYSILSGMLEDLVNDGIDTHGYHPAYVIGYLALRIAGQHPEYREGFKQLIPDWDKLDSIGWDMRNATK